jgi:predicted SAM-dependent methyltransferase
MKRVLHVGCGRQPMPPFLEGYEEVRMDIDPACEPDIVASLTDMGDVGSFDAIYGCHVLEHFTSADVARVLAECRRVLRPGGFVLMIVPNLESIRPTRDVVYESDAGPVTGLDMIYGMESMVDASPHMAHRTGFVPSTLREAFAGFDPVEVRDLTKYNLMAIGVRR